MHVTCTRLLRGWYKVRHGYKNLAWVKGQQRLLVKCLHSLQELQHEWPLQGAVLYTKSL